MKLYDSNKITEAKLKIKKIYIDQCKRKMTLNFRLDNIFF